VIDVSKLSWMLGKCYKSLKGYVDEMTPVIDVEEQSKKRQAMHTVSGSLVRDCWLLLLQGHCIGWYNRSSTSCQRERYVRVDLNNFCLRLIRATSDRTVPTAT
jgi:hypothetical protein